MYEIKRNGTKIVCKAPVNFAGGGIVAAFMSCIGWYHLWGMLPTAKEYAALEWLSAGFLFLWTLLATAGAVIFFGLFGKRVILDDSGVECRFFFRKKHFAWSEIQDFGLSYCGQTRFEGNTYHFYFSKTPLKKKNAYRKKLRGEIIKLYVIGNGYEETVRLVIPFCREKTDVEPFLSRDSVHFL